MNVLSMRLAGIRCFEDTGDIPLSSTCSLFVGQNNSGKSTLLRGLLALQGSPFDNADIRPEAASSYHYAVLTPIPLDKQVRARSQNQAFPTLFYRHLLGNGLQLVENTSAVETDNQGVFQSVRPIHYIVPFVAKRKATIFQEQINSIAMNSNDGTMVNLYAKIDEVATAGHPRHEQFKAALAEIVGIEITTRASDAGKKAGFYIADDIFVSLDRMGDGVSEMVALIVDLCTQQNKLFVIEEPETNLHPKGLKALLKMIRESWDKNQFVIATHSNIVVRELGFDERTKVFRIARTSTERKAPSVVEEVQRNALAHSDLLRELGYEFGDIGLHDGWLFLEESSAEQVITQLLIPMFAKGLQGKLRTFSAAGVDNLEPTIVEFSRLISFVHLQPVYEGKFWVRADGDEAGQRVVDGIKKKFKSFSDAQCGCFMRANFEDYYPTQFKTQVSAALSLPDKQSRRKAKASILTEVLKWSKAYSDDAKSKWSESAGEIISFLKFLETKLRS